MIEGLEQKLSQLDRKMLEMMNARNVSPAVDLQTAKFDIELARVEAKVDKLGAKKAQVKVEVEEGRSPDSIASSTSSSSGSRSAPRVSRRAWGHRCHCCHRVLRAAAFGYDRARQLSRRSWARRRSSSTWARRARDRWNCSDATRRGDSGRSSITACWGVQAVQAAQNARDQEVSRAAQRTSRQPPEQTPSRTRTSRWQRRCVSRSWRRKPSTKHGAKARGH